VKPELTFRRSLRLISKRWWLLVVGGVVFAALAFVVAGQKKTHYVATTKLTLADVAVQPNQFGPGLTLAPANPRFPTDWATEDFITTRAADAASSVLGGHPTPNQIVAGLTMTPLSINQVELDYAGGTNQAEVIDVLRRYASALISERTKDEQTSVRDAVFSYQQSFGSHPIPLKIQQNIAAVGNKQVTIPLGYRTGFEANPNGTATAVPAGGPPAVVVIVGGFLAGMAGGALLALVLGRLDKRVRRPDDIEVVGVPVVDIDSEVDPASVQLLRSELELAGIGTRLGVMAVTRATRGEGSSGLALALARTFAGVGTPTILVSADLRARKVRSEAGLSALLDGTADIAPLVRLEPNLQWLPEGSSNALPETLFSAPRVERIVRELRDQAGVIVIDTPAVLEDSETLPLIACSDIVLLAVRPGMTSWNPFGSAVALIQRVAKRPLHICYDRADETSSVPATGERRSDAAERVHQAIEVPASS
jgi:hypothetical protein